MGDVRSQGEEIHPGQVSDLSHLSLHFGFLLLAVWAHFRWALAGQPLTEAIGPLVGDEINAQFSFEGGVHVSYTSRHKQSGVSADGISLRLIGSEGSAALTQSSPHPHLTHHPH